MTEYKGSTREQIDDLKNAIALAFTMIVICIAIDLCAFAALLMFIIKGGLGMIEGSIYGILLGGVLLWCIKNLIEAIKDWPSN